MFELRIKTHFSAAHRLPGYEGSCADVHGHNWEVEVFVRGDRLNGIGMLIDFRQLRRQVGECLRRLDHSDLNELPEFASDPPTSEHIARYLFLALADRINDERCRIYRVTVWETHGAAASFFAEET